MPKRGKRSASGAQRHRMRGIENELERMTRERRRDARDAGIDPMQLSRMAAGEIAAASYTADSRIKDTRDGVMVKGRRVGRQVGAFWRDGATQRELVGSTVVPNDLKVSVEIWDAETNQRVKVMVPAAMKAIAAPPAPTQTAALTTEEKYRAGW